MDGARCPESVSIDPCAHTDFGQQDVGPGMQTRSIALVGIEVQLKSESGRHAYHNVTENQAAISSDHDDRDLIVVLKAEYVGVDGTHVDMPQGTNHTVL